MTATRSNRPIWRLLGCAAVITQHLGGAPVFTWTDDWQVRFTRGADLPARASAAFGADATADGDKRNLDADSAVARASSVISGPWRSAQNASARVSFDRTFSLEGGQNGWFVTLTGVLTGMLSANQTAGAGLDPRAGMEAWARIVNTQTGLEEFKIAWSPLEVTDQTDNIQIDANHNLNTKNDIRNLDDGGYQVQGFLRTYARLGGTQNLNVRGYARSEFFDTFRVSVNAEAAPVAMPNDAPAAVPEPATFFSLGSALLMFSLALRRRMTEPTDELAYARDSSDGTASSSRILRASSAGFPARVSSRPITR